MLIQSLATHSQTSCSVERDDLQLKRKTKVAVFKAILLTFESLLAGPTFAHCAFKGALRGTKLDAGRMNGTYIYIYI